MYYDGVFRVHQRAHEPNSSRRYFRTWRDCRGHEAMARFRIGIGSQSPHYGGRRPDGVESAVTEWPPSRPPLGGPSGRRVGGELLCPGGQRARTVMKVVCAGWWSGTLERLLWLERIAVTGTHDEERGHPVGHILHAGGRPRHCRRPGMATARQAGGARAGRRRRGGDRGRWPRRRRPDAGCRRRGRHRGPQRGANPPFGFAPGHGFRGTDETASGPRPEAPAERVVPSSCPRIMAGRWLWRVHEGGSWRECGHERGVR